MSPEDKKKIKGAVQEMSDCMIRIESEKELMTEIVKVTAEKYGVDKAQFRKIATIYHKRNLDEARTKSNEVFDLYEDLFG